MSLLPFADPVPKARSRIPEKEKGQPTARGRSRWLTPQLHFLRRDRFNVIYALGVRV